MEVPEAISWRPSEYRHAGTVSQGAVRLGRGVETVLGGIARAIEALAFWAAVGLPLVYLPLIVGGGAGQQWIALAGLLLAHVVALVAGHDYARDSA